MYDRQTDSVRYGTMNDDFHFNIWFWCAIVPNSIHSSAALYLKRHSLSYTFIQYRCRTGEIHCVKVRPFRVALMWNSECPNMLGVDQQTAYDGIDVHRVTNCIWAMSIWFMDVDSGHVESNRILLSALNNIANSIQVGFFVSSKCFMAAWQRSEGQKIQLPVNNRTETMSYMIKYNTFKWLY